MLRGPHGTAIAAGVLFAVIVGALLGLRANPPAPPRTDAAATAEPLATETPARPVRSRPERTPAARPGPRPWFRRTALAADVRKVSELGAVGVALRPLGRGSVWQTGSARSGPAWSTMKVPVVLARLRLGGGEAIAPRARAALTASDNAAAQGLFDDLSAARNGVEGASRLVQQTLRDAGDRRTVVNTHKPAGGFSTFGQTRWSLAAGTTFFRALARGCLEPPAADDDIAALMGDVVADQRWGLGSAGLKGMRFKGGWGPDADGRYLVRQFGFVRTKDDRGFVVGLLARPDDGSFATGTTMLTRLARAVAGNVQLQAAPRAARC